MHNLTFINSKNSTKLTLQFTNLDFLDFAKVRDTVKIEGKSYVVDDVKIDRIIEPTHPMIEPPGFDLVVSMTMIVSEVSE